MPNRLNVGPVVAVLGLFGFAQAALAQSPADDPCGVRKISKKIEKPMQELQKAREAKDWNKMIEKAREANGADAEKTEFDKYWLNVLEGVAYANLKQYPEALKDLEAAVNSPCIDPADKVARTKLVMQIAYQDKQYDKVIQYGKPAFESSSDPDIGIWLGNAYYINNDFQNSKAVMSAVVKNLEGAGKVPEEQTYRILQSACVNLKDNACVVDEIEKLVTHYPKPSYWVDLINSMMRASKTDKELLDILRLADGVGAMQEPDMYTEMAQLAIAQGLPGEAEYILDKGNQSGVFKDDARQKDLASRLKAEADPAVTLDKSTLDKQEASAKAKPTGEADVKLGAAFLSYGQTDKAIKAITRGVGKGGVKSPDEAGLLLGIAYLRANNKEEAKKAFGTVTQDPALARVAKMWLLHLNSMG